MPLWYTSISEEHLAVRNRVGIFDISHMGRILLNGPDSDEFLDHLIPTRAALQPPGKSFYTLLLNERGGIEDDLIVLKNAANDYLLVVNAVNTSKDLEHVTRRAKEYRVGVSGITSQSTMIAIQGPEAKRALKEAVSVNLEELKRFRFLPYTTSGHRCLISRTGYTGEDGFEMIILDSGAETPRFALKTWSEQVGRVTSGTFSPLIRRGIALCYLAIDYSEPRTPVEVKVRDSTAPAEVTRPPFYDESRYGWKRERE